MKIKYLRTSVTILVSLLLVLLYQPLKAQEWEENDDVTPGTIYAVADDDDDDTVNVNVSIGGTQATERLEVLGNVRIYDTLKVGVSSLFLSSAPDRLATTSGIFTMGNATGTYNNFMLGIGTTQPLATIDVDGTICSRALSHSFASRSFPCP